VLLDVVGYFESNSDPTAVMVSLCLSIDEYEEETSLQAGEETVADTLITQLEYYIRDVGRCD
jgi:hypothetical protein